MDWSDFYAQQAGRSVRPTFAAALEVWRASDGVAGGESTDPSGGGDAAGDPSGVVGDAVDLGCGDGVESRALLSAGFRVLAVDSDEHVVERVTAGVDEAESARLTVRRASFAELAPADGPVALPAADLVYAGFALPFCAPEVFERLWAGIRSSLRPAGLFAGQLFGPHDDFAAWPDVNTHDRADVERLLAGLDVLELQEEDRDGKSFAGPKHWHVFHIIARRSRSA
ncbi:class I SAM-dependent methyltransferase [Humibacter ginsenosidimutans]|uniref:Class I SAM-dependent methyltransferase n=1 Tax=Humibacter ginsenosidimutans TaxID=2599293 RepID=A0A5B8M4M2_9MICO|nr:class I SAM-dependent methyltransferase [Humibacter ginsenosidimutans]QDZ14530.1 class I SAM-dependent methyltransferase [Humibacter ginsenosidimutans]